MIARVPDLRPLVRSPLTWILFGVWLLRTVGIGWGLPASDGWDDDGIAPRDFLVGVYFTYLPGKFYTYPPVHLLLLTLLTAPVSAVAFTRVTSLAPPDVIRGFIRVPYMTIFAVVSRAVSGAMSVGIVYGAAKFGEELAGKRAGWCVALVVGLNATLTYYGHTTNLDTPYLFWATLALLSLARSMVRHETRWLTHMGVFAALAVGTKDQAYALFLLSVPLAVGAWFIADPWPRVHARAVLSTVAYATGLAAALLLAVDGAFVNPSGFRARMTFLLGSASRNHAYYTNDWDGRLHILRAALTTLDRYYPPLLAPLIVGGLALQLARRRDQGRFVAGLVPLLAAISFTVTFNFTARRTEHRFLLPQSVLYGIYAGLALGRFLWPSGRPWRAWLARAIAVPIGGWALYECVGVDMSLLFDPRYDAEAWMQAHVAAGDGIEVYGNNVYLPRFPTRARVVRVDPSPLAQRNPLPGVTEVQQHYARIDERRPRWIVLSEGWVWRYMFDLDYDRSLGRVLAPEQAERQNDRVTNEFFRALHAGERGYRCAYVATYKSRFWPKIDIHASTTREIRIFERDGG